MKGVQDTVLRDKVVSIIEKVVAGLKFDKEDEFEQTFEKLGIDSLDTMSIFLEIQEKFEVDEIPEDKSAELDTVIKIVDYLTETLE